MAFVICCVLRTDRMRRRMSIKLGMCRCCGPLREEPLLELPDYRVKLVAQLVVQNFLLPNLREQAAMGVIYETVQLILELAALFNRNVIQIGLGAGKNNQNLLLYR